MRSVVIISASFATVGGEESQKLLILGEKLMHNFWGSCCSGWCWIFRRDTFFHIFLMLKFGS